MMKENMDVEVARRAITIKGIEKQLMKCSEELCELAAVCSKAASEGIVDVKNMSEEMADVRFIMLQLNIMMNKIGNETFEKMVQNAYDYKVQRTNGLLDLDEANAIQNKIIKEAENDTKDRDIQ